MIWWSCPNTIKNLRGHSMTWSGVNNCMMNKGKFSGKEGNFHPMTWVLTKMGWHLYWRTPFKFKIVIGHRTMNGIKKLPCIPLGKSDRRFFQLSGTALKSQFKLCTLQAHLLGALTKLRKATIRSPCLSVSPSSWNNSAPTGRIFMKFDIWAFLENLSRKFKKN